MSLLERKNFNISLSSYFFCPTYITKELNFTLHASIFPSHEFLDTVSKKILFDTHHNPREICLHVKEGYQSVYREDVV